MKNLRLTRQGHAKNWEALKNARGPPIVNGRCPGPLHQARPGVEHDVE